MELAGRLIATPCATWAEADNKMNLRLHECLFFAVDRPFRLRQLVFANAEIGHVGLSSTGLELRQRSDHAAAVLE